MPVVIIPLGHLVRGASVSKLSLAACDAKRGKLVVNERPRSVFLGGQVPIEIVRGSIRIADPVQSLY